MSGTYYTHFQNQFLVLNHLVPLPDPANACVVQHQKPSIKIQLLTIAALFEEGVNEPHVVPDLDSVFEWTVEPNVEGLSNAGAAPRNEVDGEVWVSLSEPILELG